MNQIIYPLDRLLANPRIFHAISNRLGGPDGETLKCAFYDLLEYDLQDFEDPTSASSTPPRRASDARTKTVSARSSWITA